MVEGAPLQAGLAIRATAMAADANPYGKIFGGWLMGRMALAAAGNFTLVSPGHDDRPRPILAKGNSRG